MGTKPEAHTIAAGRLTWKAPVIGRLLLFIAAGGATADDPFSRRRQTKIWLALTSNARDARAAFDTDIPGSQLRWTIR